MMKVYDIIIGMLGIISVLIVVGSFTMLSPILLALGWLGFPQLIFVLSVGMVLLPLTIIVAWYKNRGTWTRLLVILFSILILGSLVMAYTMG